MALTWLVTGSSRGIGLEIVKQLTADASNIVFATCRTPSSASNLQALKRGENLHIMKLDVEVENDAKDAAEAVSRVLGDRGLDYLINNAGVMGEVQTAFKSSTSDLTQTFIANVAGPAQVSQAFLPMIEKSNKKTIVNISSGLGSFGRGFGPINANYSVTKAALNMLTYKQAKERPDFIVIALNPGWVKTDLGGQSATLEPHEAVSGILRTIASLTPQQSCKLLTYTGEEYPW